MKTGNILYHYTKDFPSLLGILNKRFLGSYSNEKFAGRNLKILMVSFSNHSYIDAINEVNYGDYAIGMSKSWGEKNNLHPVSYTTALSLTASSLNELIEYSALGQTIKLLSNFPKKPNELISTGNEKTDRFFDVNWSSMSKKDLKIIKDIFEDIFIDSQELQKYMKQVDVKTNTGEKKNSFLDREWRYIPKQELISSNPVIFETNKKGDIVNKEWTTWDNRDKPHQATSTLEFWLNDIKYIITNHKKELPEIYETLFRLFGRDKVRNAIEDGNLLVCSRYDLNKNI